MASATFVTRTRRLRRQLVGVAGVDRERAGVDGRRRVPVVDGLVQADLKEQAELPSLGTEPEAVLAAVVVERRDVLAGRDEIVVDPAEARAVGPPQVEVMIRP